jgi:glycosyltransferase 2 family protein
MSSASRPRRISWHSILIAGLTIGLVWVFLRSINLREAWQATLAAHPGWIAAAVGVTLQTYVIRAWRWQSLLEPIGRARFRTAFRTTVIGFAATFLLPARVGEVLRPYLLARQERLNPAAAFATVIVERLLDLCTVLLLFATALGLANIDVGPEIEAAGAAAAVASVVGLVALFILAGHPERLGRWAGRLARHLPPRGARFVGHLVQTFAEVMRSPGHLAVAMAWSVPLWLSIALGILFVSWAFDLTISFVGSFLVVGYLAVGVAAPTPGGTGGFHFMFLAALTRLFGAPAGAAGAAAIVLHLVSFVPVTILGLLYMWQDGLTLGGLQRMKSEAQAAEAVTDQG